MLHNFFLRDHLGNTRVQLKQNKTASGAIYFYSADTKDYYAFGLEHGKPWEQYYGGTSSTNPYLYNGKEMDRMHGLNQLDYGARWYDASLGRWGAVDPLAEKFTYVSSYVYCDNNPVIFTDPTGLSPIYGTDGKFLGTDNEGISGNALIIDKKDFTQGMDHSDVQKVLFAGHLTKEAQARFDVHYADLSKRPDYDGFVTAQEGIDWAKTHPNALEHPTPDNMLYIDASKLDFGNISTSDFASEGVKTPINLLNMSNSVESRFNADLYNTVYALGRVYMVLKSRAEGTVGIFNDYNQKSDRATDYDWNAGGGRIRNALIKNERFWKGLKEGDGFRVYYYGIGVLRK